MADIIETVPFNYNDIYQELVKKFEEKGYADAAYEGSNTAQLISILAYTTSMLNVNTAANINETILSLAQKRDNVVQDARMLGYEIEHERSYRYKLKLEFSVDGNYEIERYSKFSANGKNYYYMDSDASFVNKKTKTGIPVWEQTSDYLVSDIVTYNTKFYTPIGTDIVYDPENPIYITDTRRWQDITEQFYGEIEVVEGELFSYQDPENAPMLDITTVSYINDIGEVEEQYYIDIPFKNVEEDGIHIYMSYIDNDGARVENELWTKSQKLLLDNDDKFNKEFIRVDDIEYRTPRIYFKIASVGTNVRAGTKAQIVVLTTSSIDGEIPDGSTVTTELSDISVNSFELIAKGSLEEDITSIKEKAPLFYNTASRAVTKEDYKVIAERSTLVDNAEIWGGEDEFPKRLGNLFFSFKPAVLYRNFLNINGDGTYYELENYERNENYYLQDSALRSEEYDAETGLLINPGVLDDVDRYRLPALQVNVRQPSYVDVEADVKIVKYISGQTKFQTREIIFNSISSYFKDTVEDFYSEIFNSNIQKRVDSVLTDITGTIIDLKYYMNMNSSMLVQDRDNVAEKSLIYYLAFPYESIFKVDSNSNIVLDTDNLPSIETNNFIEEGWKLAVSPTIQDTGYDSIADAPVIIKDILIYINSIGFKVGEYKIFNGVKKYIIVEFFVLDDDEYGKMSGTLKAEVDNLWKAQDGANPLLTKTLIETWRRFNIKYLTKSTNNDYTSFKSFRNTIPRLKSVKIN